MTETWIPLFVIVVYLAVTTAAGSLLARRVRSPREWSVAGGGMGPAMLAAGLAGTRIGGAATYGVAGNVLAGGVWYMWWYALSTFLALALMGLVFSRPYRRLGLETVSEAFRIRDGRARGQVFTSLCVQTEYLVVDVIEAYVIAAILRSLTGVPMLPAVLLAAFLLASYTSLGGLWGAAAANLIHAGMMLIGLAAVAWGGLARIGGWHALTDEVGRQLAGRPIDPNTWWSPVGAGFLPIAGMVLSATIHTPAASIYTNFSTAARSERILVPSFLLAGVVAALMPLLAGLVGMETLALYGFGRGLAGYSHITALATDLDPWLGGIALAAILAAVISSGGPVLLSSATMFVRDWIPAAGSWTPARRLRAYRRATWIYGLVAALLAWAASQTGLSLLDLLLLGYAMVVPPAVAVGFLIYWRRTTESGAFWGMVLGYVSGVAWYAWAGLTGRGLDPSAVTTLVPLVAVPALSLLQPAPLRDAFYETLAGRDGAGEGAGR